MIAGLLERNPRLANWIWGFKPPERGTIILVHRRVYILPARLGILFAATLVILLVGSINYALALGFALTFMLGGLGLAGMVHTARNLARIGVSTGRAAPVFVVGLRGRYNERGDFLITTMPVVNEQTPPSSAPLYFPHIVDSGGYTTQFILFGGTLNQSSAGTLDLFSQSGQTLSWTLQPPQ